MQRVEPDAGCAKIGSKIDQRAQVGKVAMTPIAARPDRVKLHCQQPHPPWRSVSALVRSIGCHDQRRSLGQGTTGGLDRDLEAKDTLGKVARQAEHGRKPLALGNPALGTDLPPKRQTAGDGQEDALIGFTPHYDRAGKHPFRCVAARDKYIEELRQHCGLYRAQMPKGIAVFRLKTPPSCVFENTVHGRRTLL